MMGDYLWMAVELVYAGIDGDARPHVEGISDQ